jgi:hypothetical protein
MNSRRHYTIHRIYRFRRPLRRSRRSLVTYVVRYPELAFMIGFVAAPIAWAIYCALRVF